MRPLGNVVDKIKGTSEHYDDSHSSRGNRSKHGVDSSMKRLPILIFPGFMSSALQVKKSPTDGWAGKRVWLSVASAGFSKIYIGSALESNQNKRERGEEYDEELFEEYQKQLDCKNLWLRHLKLSEDLQSDPKGIETRPMGGLQAVNYLDPNGLVKAVSWVFHHVTKALIDVGYVEGKDLDAAPYDWRIPPNMLETRDCHFSNIMRKIEQMYEENENTPVVLLCHSMGCKTCHYFLNFVKEKEFGQEWIDTYVHTYFPVGAPHLGAPKSLRGTIVGDKMGLEAFLNEEEALICARSFGSVPWMYPYHIPKGAPPVAYLRREGALHVSIEPFDCEAMFRERNTKPSKLRLDVTYNNCTIHSSYHSPHGDQFTAIFPERFTFAARPEMPTSLDENSSSAGDDTIRISLYESGINLAERVGCCSMITNTIGRIVDIMFPAQFWRRVPCVKSHGTVSNAVAGAAITTANVATSILGSATLLADSEESKVFEHVAVENNPAEFTLQLRFGDLQKMRKDLVAGKNARKDVVLGHTSSVSVKVKAEWQPPQHDVDTDSLTAVRIGVPSNDTPDLHVHHAKDKGVPYEQVSGVQLLKSEYLPQYRKILTNVYEKDPLGPRTLSSSAAPPVKRVKAVYGVDLPTEVAAVYRRRNLAQKESVMKCLHEVDTSARINSNVLIIKDGLILETEKTPQTILHAAASDAQDKGRSIVHRSGDGTVPYYSLQQCRLWKDDCDVEIDEIPQAEHREILGDERFLKVLLDYVTQPIESDTKVSATST